jgi:hypothetical protein
MLDDTKLFDFIKIMFERPKEWKLVKQHTKKRHTFMINRFFAIKFPDNANMFNLNGIEGSNVIDSWYMVAQRFKGVPAWIYTKTKKAPAVAKAKDQYIPSDDAIRVYMERNEIGKREFKELQQFAAEKLNADLQMIENSMKVY